jgi:hypothetical protein
MHAGNVMRGPRASRAARIGLCCEIRTPPTSRRRFSRCRRASAKAALARGSGPGSPSSPSTRRRYRHYRAAR